MEPNRHDCAFAPEPLPAGIDAPASTLASTLASTPAASAQRDRRMHLRAYNHWAGLLGRRRFPTVADLAAGTLGDIALHSVLLEIATDLDDPAIAYLGERLADECGAREGTLHRLAEVPAGSLLGRLTGHYRAVLVNRAPTGFESEFAGSRGATVLYRGILLPFSSDDATIDFVLAVINWKERASEEAPRPQGEAREEAPCYSRAPSPTALLTDWADGPGSELGDPPAPSVEPEPDLAGSGLPGEEAPFPGEAVPATLSAALAESLRVLPLLPFTALPPAGAEFALAMIRRPAGGPAALLGEVPHDAALIEHAAQLLAR